jgi:hypothetical protein
MDLDLSFASFDAPMLLMASGTIFEGTLNGILMT